MSTILHTAEGIEALAKFLETSGAMTKTSERRGQGSVRLAAGDQLDVEEDANDEYDAADESDEEATGGWGEAAEQTDEEH